MRRALAAACAGLACATALVGAGCERKSEAAAPAGGAPSARVVATADHGAEVLLDERVAPGRSVMDALQGETPVETAYGGGFVASMLGRGSSTSPPTDWFFYVNGFESPVGARAAELRAGDVAWWDHRVWQGMQSVRAVVGAWPEPFVRGAGAQRPVVAADPPLAGALRSAGARMGTGEQAWRARVGTDATLTARDSAWRATRGDPGGARLAGGIRDGQVVLMPPGGGAPVPVEGARAVAVLVPAGAKPTDGALLAVAGLDARAARAAADTIAATPDVLSLRYAVAFDAAGQPMRAAGRTGP
ncbi:MAG: DUF4430 domain-containing protein [Actinomycetota bacterium]